LRGEEKDGGSRPVFGKKPSPNEFLNGRNPTKGNLFLGVRGKKNGKGGPGGKKKGHPSQIEKKRDRLFKKTNRWRQCDHVEEKKGQTTARFRISERTTIRTGGGQKQSYLTGGEGGERVDPKT